ncbi:MAG: hypothetical protein PHX61_01215 [Alphaproteobacteria bacterium]|nr:hypothetical protein [Alphaproteobacteria bacterium]
MMDKKNEQGNQKLTAFMNDYSIWFSQVVRAAFYPDVAEKELSGPPRIDTIPEIIERIGSDSVLSRLKEMQGHLHQLAAQMISTPNIPKISDFDMFWQTYEGFSNQIQRIEKDSLLSDFGVDIKTGLRSSAVMIVELERELERRARRGQPFSIAILRIDDEELRTSEAVLEKTSFAIGKTIRSFDDAYVSGDGEFIISLKHSDTNGGLRFVSRFNQALKFDLGADFTVSSCVAEPLPGDDVPSLLANIRADLDSITGTGKGVTGQYEEISPLNRFLQKLEENPSEEEKKEDKI